ncbi:MAG: hypothetical protein GQ574_21740 [Crocinitomix sp.]|nr:hypothetical protein [Crocinitomix sp.]
MDQIIELIKQHDWRVIFNYAESLNDTERLDFQYKIGAISYPDIDSDNGEDLKGKARETFYEDRQKNAGAIEYAKLVSIRSFDEFKKSFPNEMGRLVFGSSWGGNTGNHAQKIHFFKQHPPNYLDKLIKREKLNIIEFEILWKFYKNGWIEFDEELFVNSLFYVQMFTRDTEKDAAFLIENPDAIEKILLQFYRYEIEILDISKWESREGFQCTKIHKFWTEVFTILIEKGVEIPRNLITNLLESLLNHWKKPHLNWHIQILKLLEPTSSEYIADQHLLFSALSSENNTIVNYAVGAIKSVHKEKDFDFETCFDSISVLFVNEKINKSLLEVLKIIDYGVSKDATLKETITESLCLGLTTSNTKIQTEFASRIAAFCSPNELEELVTPYLSYLKSESKEILAVEKKEELETSQLEATETVIEELNYPKNWDELLEHISKTIRTKDPADMDVLLESLIQLNDQLPPNYQKQLGSYKKQLSRESWDSLLRYFSEFFLNYVNNSDVYEHQVYNSNPSRLPYLSDKFIKVFQQLKTNSKLSILSTPTHTPCYIHPEILIDRLLEYESANSEIDWIDLTVACNRILKNTPCNDFADKANSLQGKYAKAINYLIGNSDEIELAVKTEKPKKSMLKSLFGSKKESQEEVVQYVEEELLSLWAQVTRTRDVDGVYNAFKNTILEDKQSVVGPLNLGFEIRTDKSGSYTWTSLDLEKGWNSMGSDYSQINNYAYSNSFHLTESDHDMYYQASLVINYIDPLLCSHVFFYCNTEGIHSAPLKFILDNNIKVYHSGWIYIAACLLTNGKEVRAMAEEYIVFALANKFMKQTYLSEIIAKLIVTKFIPVKRLTDYIERSFAIKELKELHFCILSKCIEQVDLEDKPRSFPKIVTLFKEFQKDLKIESSSELMVKLKRFKK